MTGVRLQFISEAGAAALRSALQHEDSLRAYQRGECPDIVAQWIHTSALESAGAAPVLVAPPDTRVRSGDAENATRIHTWLARLPPAIAADHRLWTLLTHREFFDYCLARWPLAGSTDKVRNAIVSHWFVGGGRGGLRRNAIARLWWAGALTFAPWDADPGLQPWAKQDPYHFTRVLLSNQDIYQGLVERRYGSSLRIRILLLQVMEEVMVSREQVRASLFVTTFLKTVNLLGAHTDLDSMDCSMSYRRLKDAAGRAADRLDPSR